MNTTPKARTANDIANLFFVQKLADTKSRVARGPREWTSAMSEGNRSSADFKALSLYDTCIDGKIETIISHNQGVWLSKMLAQEQRWHKHSPHTVTYESRSLGSTANLDTVTPMTA